MSPYKNPGAPLEARGLRQGIPGYKDGALRMYLLEVVETPEQVGGDIIGAGVTHIVCWGLAQGARRVFKTTIPAYGFFRKVG